MSEPVLHLIESFAILGILGTVLIVIAILIDLLPEPN